MDLFLEVLRKAVEDDDDAKQPVYAGVLEWGLREKPSFAEVRILSDGVRLLTYLEIYCLLYEMAGNQARRIHEPLISIERLVEEARECRPS